MNITSISNSTRILVITPSGIIFHAGMSRKVILKCLIPIGVTVTFNIINLLKVDSSYNEGMKPCVYSKRQEENIGTKWHRAGFDICYRKNASKKTSVITKAIDEVSNDDLKKELYKRIKVLHTLTFKYTFVYENDVVFFAHFYPYSFTDLEKYLAKTTADDANKKILRVDILCKSLSNNPCYMLTITNKIKTYLGSQDEAMLLK